MPVKHLIFLSHGLQGHFSDLDALGRAVVAKFPAGETEAVLLESNSTFLKTMDGIYVGSRRIADAMEEKMLQHPQAKISVVGHSLGGLYIRCAIGILEERSRLAERVLISYVSLATPHLGSRRPKAKVFNAIVNTVTLWSFGQTGRDLMLQQAPARRPGEEDPTLLVEMTRPASSYMQGIARFAFRTAVANVKNDIQVPYCSAAIALASPYDLTVPFVPASSPCYNMGVRVRGASAGLDAIPAIRRCWQDGVSVTIPAADCSSSGEFCAQTPSDAEILGVEMQACNDGLAEVCPHMHRRLHRLPWRHLDLELDVWSSHDAMIGKWRVFIPFVSAKPGPVVDAMIAEMLASDHQISYAR